jgi:hypothetical protein
MIALGFVSSSGFRFGAACLFAFAAFFAVLSIEQQSHLPITPSVAAIPAPTISSLLVLESTFPVQRWSVQVKGVDVTAIKKESHRFEATISGDPTQCFVQADSADALSTSAVAVRWHYAGQSGIWWGEGSVAGTLSATQVK